MNIDHVVRSSRKSVAIYIRPDGSLEVRAPLRLNDQVIQAFVDSKTDWIARQRNKLDLRQTPGPRDGYANGDSLWFLGLVLTLHFTEDKNQRFIIEADRLMVPIGLQDKFERALTAWYRAEARRIISTRTEYFASQNGLQPKSISINAARSRWGSCGVDSSVNFPYRLVMLPLEIIDYVIVHELAHTVEHNHGKRFWAKVAAILPDYLWRRKWLRLNGHLFDLKLKVDPDKVVPVEPKVRRKPTRKKNNFAH